MGIKSFLIVIGLVIPLSACNSDSNIIAKKDAVVLILAEKDSEKSAIGTGFFINKNTIITNHHVVENAKKIQIGTEKGKDPYEVEVVHDDPMVDLAVIKIKDWDKFIKENRVVYLNFAYKDSIDDLETVYAIGHPWGLTWSISKGVISNKLRRPTATPKVLIQTDAKIYEGNSGGPLLDENGDVVGVNNLMISNTGGSYGFSILAPLVQKVLRDFEKYKEARWALIGITIDDDGTIKEIADNSAADKSGLKPNDKISLFETTNGLKIFKDLNEFLYEVSLTDYQDKVKITVERNKEIVTFDVSPSFKTSNDFLPKPTTPP